MVVTLFLTLTGGRLFYAMDTIIKETPQEDFVQIRNAVAQDPQMSVEAKGMILYLSSLPRSWTYSATHIERVCNMGRTKRVKIMRELEEKGHAALVMVRGCKTFSGSRWIFFSSKEVRERYFRSNPNIYLAGISETRDAENLRLSETEAQETCALNKEELSKKEITNNKELTPIKPKPANEPSDKGQAFAEWFSMLLAETNAPTKPSKTDKLSWAREFDKLIRLDAIEEQEIKHLCGWARRDEFWRRNFYTPMKLRKKNREGVSYIAMFRDRAPAMPVERAWQEHMPEVNSNTF
jgi:hypothetical protein